MALAATAALVTTNAQATTDLLVPPPVPQPDGGITFDATDMRFPVFLLIPNCNASVTAAASQMTGNVSDYVVEFRSDVGGVPDAVVGSLAQDNSGASVASYTGNVSVSAGVSYWVGVKATTGALERLEIRTGVQASQWRWATSGVNRQGTTNGGGSWDPISDSDLFPDLTLRGTCETNASGAPSVERLVKLSLVQSLPPGITCSSQAVEGTSGSWVQLPGAQDCTTSAADGPTLLGWATQANFPVQIAQRQVTNGWGAYETFDDSGALTGVFIPAGGFTVLSADTDLYPIWS